MSNDEELLEEENVEKADEEEIESPVETQDLAPPKYEVLPGLQDRFKSLQIKDVINACMAEQLSGRDYRTDQAARWVKQIANNIRMRVEKLCMNRYKILVVVSLAEMKGAGLTCALRCIWDPDSDNFVHDSFQNNTVYAHATVFGVYLY